jgi:Rha family phage regulatory protein
MLTNNNAVYYPSHALAKSSVGIGLPVSVGDTSTLKFVENCVLFCVSNLPFCVSPKLDSRNFMVGCVGELRLAAPIDGKTNPAQPATLRLVSLDGEENHTSIGDNQMSNAQVASAISTNTSAVFLKDGKAITTSEHVAKIFKKEHKHVLRDIQELDCSENFRKLNFQLTHETRKIGVANRQVPIYEMTRDGFTFLCMGYTGKEAAKFKELYINRFNEMEKRLQEKNNKPDFEGRWVVNIEDGLPKTFSPIHPQAHIATPEEFAQRISNGFVSSTDVSVILQACISHLTGQKIKTGRPAENSPNPKDKVDLAKAFLNVVGQHGDRVRLAKELGIHTSTAQKVFSGLYRIANREVYGE